MPGVRLCAWPLNKVSYQGLIAGLWLLFGSVGVSSEQGRPMPSVWGCLLYASNTPSPVQAPDRINPFDKTLEEETGFKSLQRVGENQTAMVAGRDGVLTFPGELRVTITNLSQERDGRLLVALQVYRGNKELLLTQARLREGVPLFIRGPAWRQGELIIAVVIGS
jgi:hypothetical protein